MALNIPVPQTMMSAFLKTRDEGIQNDLRRAQMAQAYGAAQKSQMLSQLMGQAFGGGGQAGQPGQAGQVGDGGQGVEGSGGGGQPAAGGQPGAGGNRARDMLYALGYLKETPAEQEAREARVAERKSQTDVSASAQKEQEKQNIKKSEDLVETGNMINKYAQHSIALSDLLNKKDITGNLAALGNWLNLSGEDVGTFNENSTPLVGQLAKDLSTRGGAVVSGMAAAAKPSLQKGRDYNLGVLNELHKQTYQSYQTAKRDWERLNPGKIYPVKLPKFYEQVRVRSPLGHVVIKSPEEAQRLIKKYKGSQILGLAYGD